MSEPESLESLTEPPLLYHRLGHVSTDSITAICHTPKLLCVGTSAGHFCVLDIDGHIIKRYTLHTLPIRSITLDAPCEYAMTSGDDGKVFLYGLYTNITRGFQYRYTVRHVHLLDRHERQEPKRFVCSVGDHLILHEKSWLLQEKDSVLSSGEGVIQAQCVDERERAVAWADEKGVKVMKWQQLKKVGYVARPVTEQNQNSKMIALQWTLRDQLCIAWSHQIQMCQWHSDWDEMSIFLSLDLSDVSVVAMSLFHQEREQIALLTRMQDELQPELRLYQQDELVTVDLITFEPPSHHSHFLSASHEGLLLATEQDLITARPLSMDDRIQWWIERHAYDKALQLAREAERPSFRPMIIQLAQHRIHQLLEQEDFEAASQSVVQVADKDKDLWWYWINAFEEHSVTALIALSASLPVLLLGDVTRLLVQLPIHKMYQWIQQWPREVFSCNELVIELEQRLETMKSESESETNLQLCYSLLAQLYEWLQNYTVSLEYHLLSKSESILSFIARYGLYHDLMDRIKALLQVMDSDQTVLSFLVLHYENISVNQVLTQLNETQEWIYLDLLQQHAPVACAPYHDRLLYLYVNNAPDSVLSLLQSSQSISLDKALILCRDCKLYKEWTYVLSRMGCHAEALHLMLTQLKDETMAVEYVLQQRDQALWVLLMEQGSPALWFKVLEMKLPLLKWLKLLPRDSTNRMDHFPLDWQQVLLDSLKETLNQQKVIESCQNMLLSEHKQGLDQWFSLQKQARKVTLLDKTGKALPCRLCQKALFHQDIIILPCDHVMHTSCLSLMRLRLGQEELTMQPISMTPLQSISCPFCT